MKRGFTLIELLVSVGIFAIVMTVALGALLSISAADKKAQSTKTVMDNLNFALESMSRTIRTGLYYHCGTSNISGTELPPQDCSSSSGDTFFVFKANEATTPYTVYCLSGTTIWRLKTSSVGGVSTSCGSTPAGYLSITAPEVKIESLKFYTIGSLPYPSGGSSACASPPAGYDCMQPRVVMTVSGYVEVGAAGKSPFNIQTTVTQRLYDQ